MYAIIKQYQTNAERGFPDDLALAVVKTSGILLPICFFALNRRIALSLIVTLDVFDFSLFCVALIPAIKRVPTFSIGTGALIEFSPVIDFKRGWTFFKLAIFCKITSIDSSSRRLLLKVSGMGISALYNFSQRRQLVFFHIISLHKRAKR